jgi:hypothetical protein
MQFGIGFTDLSEYTEEWLSSAWDTNGDGTLTGEDEALWSTDKTSFMSQYIAVNHPSDAEADGSDFVAYDWNYGRGFAFDPENLEILMEDCESDPSQQCFVPVDMQASQGRNAVYLMSGARWYENLPYPDLSMMQENNSQTRSSSGIAHSLPCAADRLKRRAAPLRVDVQPTWSSYEIHHPNLHLADCL